MSPRPLPARARNAVGRAVRRGLGRIGYELIRKPGREHPIPADCDERAREVIKRVRPYTLTTPERIMALREAIRHLERTGVPGAIVECGVWRGGSMIAAAMTLLELGATDRDIYMYDTFTEMPPPDERDVHLSGVPVADLWDPELIGHPHFSHLPLDRVRELLHGTGYPPDRLHFVQGLVEETLPGEAPERVALLRLDTDHYRSTAHEMAHLYPRIAAGGLLIVDDYGEYLGAKRAVDEHLAADGRPVLLNRVDLSCRMAIVPARE